MSDYSNYSIAPVYLVRSWISSQFLNSTLVNQIDYNNIDPIIPVQDVDKTSKALGKLPYIVYSSSPAITFNQEVYYIKEEIMRVSTLSNNVNQLNAISNFLVDILDRRDLTAFDINTFSSSEAVNFKTFTMIRSSEIEPVDQPAGRFVQTITFKYSYTRPLDSSGRFAF